MSRPKEFAAESGVCRFVGLRKLCRTARLYVSPKIVNSAAEVLKPPTLQHQETLCRHPPDDNSLPVITTSQGLPLLTNRYYQTMLTFVDTGPGCAQGRR